MLSTSQRLMRAVEEKWCGTIEFELEGEPIGSMVLSEGKIAWATCKWQTETLGMYLWRMGRVSRTQLQELQKAYAQYGGKRKLGHIVQEMGLMSRTVFRRCLLLHTRSAVEKLVSNPATETRDRPGAPQADEQSLFGLEEVLPPLILLTEGCRRSDETSSEQDWCLRVGEASLFDDLAALPGHQASLLVSADGEVITAMAAGAGPQRRTVAAMGAGVMDYIARIAISTGFAPVSFAMFDYQGGTVAVRQVDDEQGHLLVVLLDRRNSPAFARNVMSLTALKAQAWLASGTPCTPVSQPS